MHENCFQTKAYETSCKKKAKKMIRNVKSNENELR